MASRRASALFECIVAQPLSKQVDKTEIDERRLAEKHPFDGRLFGGALFALLISIIVPIRVVKKGSVVSILRVLTKRGGDDEKTADVSSATLEDFLGVSNDVAGKLRPPGNPRPWGFPGPAPSFIARKSARSYASLQALTCLRSPSRRPRSLRFNLLPEVSRRSQTIEMHNRK